MLGTSLIRPSYYLTVLDFKCTDDVFRRHSALWRRRPLIDDVYPAFALSLPLGNQSGQFRTSACDHGVHEFDENPVSRKDAGSNSLPAFQGTQKNADYCFGWQAVLKNLLVAQARNVVLRSFRSVHTADVDGQIGHARILLANR